MNNKAHYILKRIAHELLIVVISYSIVHLFKYQDFYFYPFTFKVLLIIFFCRMIIQYTLKDLWNIQFGYFRGLFHVIKSSVYHIFFVSFIIIWFDLYRFSRLLIFGTILLLSIFDFIRFHILYLKSDDATKNKQTEHKDYKKVFLYFFLDLFLWLFFFFLINPLDYHQFTADISMQTTFLLMTGLWFGASFLTEKFTTNFYNNFWHIISPLWKSTVIIGTGTAFLRVLLGSQFISEMRIIPFLFAYTLTEIMVLFVYYIVFKIDKRELVQEENINIDQVIDESDDIWLEDEKYAIDTLTRFVEKKNKNNTIKSLQELIDFIASIPKLKSVRKDQTVTYDTEHLFNIEEIKPHSLNLLINMHQVNDFSSLNDYFLTIYRKLVPGGYFVSKVRTIHIHKERFFKKYPKFIAQLFYVFHYLFYRIFPYTPVLDKIFYLLKRGRRTVIAKAEVLGRLYYCGYKIVSTHEIGDYLYFVSQKSDLPSLKETPTSRLIIKLKRVGMNGSIFNLYKFRTMYPYSEYLQEYIYHLNQLSGSGKYQNDFRITGWGKFLRKFWLDELPQIYNYIRGDLKLVGARALSYHYFSLYPPEMRAMRIRYKNGLLPPYYADMPKDWDEIIESERRYFQNKKQKPYSTDIIYFFKIVKNILIHKRRSM
ncbi:MAG: sugar transferase [Fidelibacterota bacterium]